MKFSTSLKFNAVAEWWDYYIAYSALKKQIYQLEKQQVSEHDHTGHDLESNEHTALMASDQMSTSDRAFIPLLDRELTKICLFYEVQEKELQDEVNALEELIKAAEEDGNFRSQDLYQIQDDEDEDDDDEEEVSRSPNRGNVRGSIGRRRRISNAKQSPAMQTTRSRSYSEGSPVLRRYSLSSEDDNAELEASLLSLGQIPENTAPQPSDHQRFDSKASRRKRALSSLVSRIIPSASTSEEPVGASDSIWTARTNYAFDTRALFKRRITTLYITLTSLRSYVELNYSGFRKILKKYDKVTYSELLDRYLHEVVEERRPFKQETRDKLNELIDRVAGLFAKCVTRGDHAAALRMLRIHQREHIAWERDTVWRQMIASQRKGESDGEATALGAHVETSEEELLHVETPVGRIRLTRKMIALIVAVAAFIVLLNTQTVDGAEANRCLAILVFATILWATEAIPLFVTSILIPLLLVCLGVLRDVNSVPYKAPDATKYIFQQMFSPTIMLLIGGFTISSAISKTNIDRVLITRVLYFAGTKPSTVLLAFMIVSCFASMWISNVAAPTLCFTLIRPILRTLPSKSSFAPCLILGIALAANIGGQSSPISSPQNLIALDAMEPRLDWGSWFAVALPVSAVSILLIWLLLLVSYRPSMMPDGDGELEIRPIRPIREKFTLKQYWVTCVCIVTIIMWVLATRIDTVFGDMGVIAIIPIVAFFSTGVLRKDDFEQFLWTIVFLAMGGIALGKGVDSSGLLLVMDTGIRGLIDGYSLTAVVFILSAIVLVVSTFISHTIASVLLVPIAKTVGGTRGNLLIFLTGLLCSTGMGMPVSGFPNQTAATQENEVGQLYLTNIDFLKNGVPASIIAALVVATLGYVLMIAIGL